MIFIVIILNTVGCFRLIHEYQTHEFVKSRQKHIYTPDNLTPEVVLTLIKFTFILRENSEQHQNQFCLPIAAVTTDDTISFHQLSLNKQKDAIVTKTTAPIYFDYQSSLSNSDIHLVQFQWNQETKLQFLTGDLFNQYANFKLLIQIYVRPNGSSQQCINDCQSYIVNKNSLSPFKTCQNAVCQCGYRFFGQYCQFEKTIVYLGSQVDVKLEPQKWLYLGYQMFDQLDDTMFLLVKSLSMEVLISFGFYGVAGHDVPSLYQNFYSIPASESMEINFESYISHYKQLLGSNNHPKREIYIGIMNPQKSAIQFQILVKNNLKGSLSFFFHSNQILLTFIAINLIISILFLCYNRYRTIAVQRRNEQNQNQSRVVTRRGAARRRKPKGFRAEFIASFFPPYELDDLLMNYPALKDQDECVICLESMRHSEFNCNLMCSLTPCFHLYHHECLKKWFLVQRYCPICREQFTEIKIRRSKKWVNLVQSQMTQQQSVTGRNEYIKRIKKSRLDESQNNSNASMLDQTVMDNSQNCVDESQDNILPVE